MTFFPAVILAAYIGGFWPGMLATILSIAAANYFLTENLRYLRGPSVNDVAAAVLFVLVGTFISGLGEIRRRSLAVLLEQASLLDLTHDSVFVRDSSDVIIYWNRASEELYGWTRAEALGKVSHQLMQTVFPAPLQEITAELLRTGRWEGELIHTRRDGTHVLAASRWSLQRDAEGNSIGVLETNNDVTERKRAEEGLRKAQAELAHVTRVTTAGELTASIAHEVNQPLAAIVTNGNACLRWLDRKPPNQEEAREAVGRIIKDGTRASEIIGRIRALVTKTPRRQDSLDINEIITDVVALARSEINRNRISLQIQFTEDLPPMRGDRVQLQQVILNLVINGIEAMSGQDEGARELLIRSGHHGDKAIHVMVCDSGIGLDNETPTHLFDAFYSTKPTGMGMGLAISRSIIEAHGGRIWAESNVPQGAVFQFTLQAGDEGVK
jgi:PAS domain S-box-containing protein